MATKTDYTKGVTAGLAMLKKAPKRYREYPHTYEHELKALARNLEDKYRESIGELVCPFTGEPGYMRVSWYREGISDAIRYGHGAKFVVVKYTGTGCYNVAGMAEPTVYDDPAFAWKKSWELDPHGHEFKSIDVLYVNGAARELGLEEFYVLSIAEVK
jgi:hypothetical protein